MRTGAPITRDLLLIGGGHAHAIVLRRWGMAPPPGVRVTLVNPEPSVLYTGMLPGYVAGHYGRDDLAIDLVKLARFAGARLVLDRVIGLDLVARQAVLAGRPSIAFDIASINIGVTSQIAGVLAVDATPAKPMAAFALAWERFIARVRSGEGPPRAAVIGGGVGGVELAMAMAQRLRAEAPAPAEISVTLIERAVSIAPHSGAAARKLLTESLRRSGVRVLTATLAADAPQLQGVFIAQAAGARPAPWLAQTELALTSGFVRTDRTLRSVSHAHIFAAGDTSAIDGAAREKAGVFAVRQAPALHHNLLAALCGGRPREFRSQRDHLKLISLGGKAAVAEKWGVALRGRALWTWKDVIDRRFMARLTTLPAMARAAPTPGRVALGLAEFEAGEPLCGGCGSKVGPVTLKGALAGLAPPARADVLQGAGDDCAVLTWGADPGGRAQVITSDHFRAFTLDPYLLARISAQHALGDVWAMGAAPQAAIAAIILPLMTPAKQGQTLREIFAALETTLGDAGADLVGGHTSLGAELTLGLTITGLTGKRPPIGLGGAKAGDALILSKPIGVGTVLAAEMRGLAKGEWVAAAVDQMSRSGAQAATLLGAHARAMTDVTGFGLAGHLRTMLEASSMDGELWLDAISWTPGAVALSAAGVRSSIFPQNAQLPLDASAQARADSRFALLFDPQTAGGLLAALPRTLAADVLGALADAGENAMIIGQVLSPARGAARLSVRMSRAAADD